MTQRYEGHDYRDSKNKGQAYERNKKYPVIIDMIMRWLDTNIDDNQKSQNELFFDSYELKEKIKLALDPETTKRQIEDGDF